MVSAIWTRPYIGFLNIRESCGLFLFVEVDEFPFTSLSFLYRVTLFWTRALYFGCTLGIFAHNF